MKLLKLLLVSIFIINSQVIFAQIKQEKPSKKLDEYLKKLQKSDAVTEALVESVVNGDDKVKVYSIKTLALQKNKNALPIFLDYLGYGLTIRTVNKGKYEQTSAWEVRLESAIALGRVKDPKAIPFLEKMLKMDNSYIVKKGIIWALGELKSEQSVPLLTKILKLAKDQSVVMACVKALGKIGNKKSFMPLLSVTQGNYIESIKKEAVKSLEMIKWEK